MSKKVIIFKNTFLFGILPALSFIIARFGYIYKFNVRKIDTDFVVTSIGTFLVFLLIGYLIGLKTYERYKKGH